MDRFYGYGYELMVRVGHIMVIFLRWPNTPDMYLFNRLKRYYLFNFARPLSAICTMPTRDAGVPQVSEQTMKQTNKQINKQTNMI